MNFDKYWEFGSFVLHSGDESHKLWNARLLFREENAADLAEILLSLRALVPEDAALVGIKTAGAWIAKKFERAVVYDPRADALEGELGDAPFVLFDDVLTRGSSIRDAVRRIGRKPLRIVVILVRDDINGGLEELDGIPVVELRRTMASRGDRP